MVHLSSAPSLLLHSSSSSAIVIFSGTFPTIVFLGSLSQQAPHVLFLELVEVAELQSPLWGMLLRGQGCRLLLAEVLQLSLLEVLVLFDSVFAHFFPII
jgi:hypothetical protein